MQVEQVQFAQGRWHAPSQLDADWLLVFGASDAIAAPGLVDELRRRYPRAEVLGCSTAGEVLGTRVHDDSLAVTAIRFASTRVRIASLDLTPNASAVAAGEALALGFVGPGLRHVFVLCEGIHVNGSALIAGLLAALPPGVTVSGGLAADGVRMTTTAVLTAAGAGQHRIAAAGLYGDRIAIGHGSMGGWDPFGPERIITRAVGNVVYELDDQPALALYERYLGPHAPELPTSGLLFPLTVRAPDGGPAVTRTLLGIDRATGAIRFAGDMPVGHVARLMRANIDRLIDGASGAARACVARLGATAELALVVSCAGRRIVMGQRIEEELDALAEVLGPVPMAGFYANGELGPAGVVSCVLHNQTMTATTLREI